MVKPKRFWNKMLKLHKLSIFDAMENGFHCLDSFEFFNSIFSRQLRSFVRPWVLPFFRFSVGPLVNSQWSWCRQVKSNEALPCNKLVLYRFSVMFFQTQLNLLRSLSRIFKWFLCLSIKSNLYYFGMIAGQCHKQSHLKKSGNGWNLRQGQEP